MLERETTGIKSRSENVIWEKASNSNGDVVWINRISGDISSTLPEQDEILYGGILAEEMGLGKTVIIFLFLSSSFFEGKKQRCKLFFFFFSE